MPRAPFRWTPRQQVELILDEEEDGSGNPLREDVVPDDATDERTFIAVSGGSWERRLTQREKVIRGGISIGVVLAIGLTLLGGPGSVLAYLGGVMRTMNPAPVAEAAAPTLSTALDVPIPANIAENPLVALTPVNGPNALAFACWVDEDGGDVGKVVAPLHLAEYAVTSHNWTPLTPPVMQAASCTIVTDMTVPDRVALVLAHAVAVGSPCQLPDIYHSEDSGAHWAGLPWPQGALTPCDLRYEMEGGRLYVESDTPLLSAENTAADAGQISITADGGATWAAADAGLAGLSQVSLIALRPSGRLLAQGIDPQRRGDTTLWQSEDAGAHWRFVVTVPGANPHVYASSNPQDTSNGGWGRLYIYSGVTDAPSLRRLTEASDGTSSAGASLLTGFAEPQWVLSGLQLNGAAVPRWSSVALPAGTATPDTRPAGMWLREASEGPVDSLFFTQPHASSLIAAITLPIDLLMWNGTTWSTNAQVIPSNAYLQGVTWDHGVMRIWVTHKAGILRPVQLLTFTISPADIG